MAQAGDKLSKNQKLALAGLTVFGIFIIILSVVNFNNEIRKPLRSATVTDNSSNTTNSDDNLKTQDTDGDGLSDWDEINIYHTSPYLSDSDSDGIPDGVEISNGTDPNCPQGKDCSVSSLQASSTNGLTNSLSPNLSVSASSSQADLSNMLTGQSDATALRKLLLDAGMNKADLDKISDKDLINSYKQMLASSSQSQ